VDFVERYFGISPDGGDSSLEIMLAARIGKCPLLGAKHSERLGVIYRKRIISLAAYQPWPLTDIASHGEKSWIYIRLSSHVNRP